jgi:hypothetical protein
MTAAISILLHQSVSENVFRATTSQAETFEHEMVMRFNCRFTEHAEENTARHKNKTERSTKQTQCAEKQNTMRQHVSQ